MCFSKAILTGTIFLLFTLKTMAQSTDSVAVYLSIKDSLVSKRSDMVLSVIVQSKSVQQLQIPKYAEWGFLLENGGTGFFSVELERKNSTSYKNIALDARIDGVPQDLFDTLKQNESVKSAFPIGGTFKPVEGDYRVRVLCFISENNPQFHDIYSNWVYFHCQKDVQLFGKDN